MGSCIGGGGWGGSYKTFGTWGRGKDAISQLPEGAALCSVKAECNAAADVREIGKDGDKKYIYFFYFWLIYAQY